MIEIAILPDETRAGEIRTKTAEYWLGRLSEESVPCAQVLTRTEVMEHPQVQANDLLVCYDHPQAGHIRQARSAARFSGEPGQPWQGAPAMGEHTRELLERCSYSREKMAQMVGSGIAGVSGST